MRPPTLPRVKICCISSVAEARLAVSLGADALGLVSAMPSGPGVIAEELMSTRGCATRFRAWRSCRWCT